MMAILDTESAASSGGGQAAQLGEAIVEAQKLVKRYGRVTAVDGVSFTIRRGEIFGLLGPNGAGKSTTLDILEGIRAADGGTVLIDGLDVRRNRRAIQARIGVQLQATSLFEYLQVRETLALFGSFYPKDIAPETLLREVALDEKAHSFPQDLSGGQRQRLALALALVNDPTLVFLDEPTSGLDPQSRRLLWEQVQRLRERGKTVVLTTHFMDEAQTLCDRIAIMDNGRIIAQDTPAALIATLGASAAIECALVSGAMGAPLLADDLRGLPGATEARLRDDSALIYTDRLEATLVALLRLAGERGTQIERLQTHAPTLEDVFLKLTGRGLRD
jgi:ABC-2 type transport system ATP-binding protein